MYMLDFTKHVLKLDTGTGLHILILLCTDFPLRHKDCYEKLCTRTFFNVFVTWAAIWRKPDSKNVNSWPSNL